MAKGGCLCQWELKAHTDRSQSDCECPLYNRIIVELSKKVVDNIARKYERIKKGVDGIMGGKVIETEAKKMEEVREEMRVNRKN